MHCIPTFAGLGSEALFSTATLDAAEQDARIIEARILLAECHLTFQREVAYAVSQGLLAADDLDMADFDEPNKLVRPPVSYHRNPIVQHTTLYLVQMLRYIHFKENSGTILGVAGFCAGILPAATVATSRTPIELLSRAHDFFYVALWTGIRSLVHQVATVGNDSSLCLPQLPWSVILDGLTVERAHELQDEHIYVSAVNSPTCVTMSGRGDRLRDFITQRLPPGCRARRTTVHALYHSSEHLAETQKSTLRDLETRPLQLSTAITMSTPLCSTTNGEWLTLNQPTSLRELVENVLEMIFTSVVDWVAVQKAVVAKSGQLDSPVDIINFGPGYGISATATQSLPERVRIVDLSTKSKHTPPDNMRSPPISSFLGDDIAIVGMAVDAPGASDAESLWKNLESGVNMCSEIPTSRFNVDDFYNKQNDSQASKGKNIRTLKTRYGNFLENPFMFDNELFDVSRREALSMDPQQRVLLQTAYRALENAGYVPDSTPSFQRDTFGCWVGNATLDYTDNLRDNIDVYYSPGTLRTFQSARISYVFSWSGPSITLDTACSSSTVALHQAARAIAAGDCRAAIVGGVNVITSPDMYLGLDRAHFLSPSGQCKAFDASADGYCRAEGCAIFVIKKVKDAVAEGDRIIGIVRGVEINQSGNTHSITHPHVDTQEQLFHKVLSTAKIHPHQVTAVELHGTGTQAGDPSEVESVRRVLCKGRNPENPVHLTSIKANVGHSEAASGAMGLAKLLLMMQHQRIPPQISLKQLNSRIKPLGVDGAAITTEGIAWPRVNGQPRVAVLNNFGAGGSNAAVVIQEWSDVIEVPKHLEMEQCAYAFGFSAKSASALEKLRQLLAEQLSRGRPVSLRDVSATMLARRQLYDHRISLVAQSVEDLVNQLRATDSSSATKAKGATKPEAVFVFSGQGSQYLGMGRELLSAYPAFAATVNECDRFLIRTGQSPCKQIISGEWEANAQDAETVQAFQSAVFVLEVALAQLLMSWGIRPTAVAGHSLGEYAALVVAGVLDMQSGLTLVSQRARLMTERCELGATGMLAVNMSAAAVRSSMSSSAAFASIEVACSNSADACVVGGPLDQLQLLKTRLTDGHGTKSKLLDVPMAYHTKAMDPVLDELSALAGSVGIRRPRIPVVSSVLGRTVQAGEDVFGPAYFARHCRETVLFAEAVGAFARAGPPERTVMPWIEIGPHPSLLSLLPLPQGALLLPTLRKGVAPALTMARLLSALYRTTNGIEWRRVFAGARLVDLPGMPFGQESFTVPFHEPAEASSFPVVPSPLPDSFAVHAVRGAEYCFETPLAMLEPFIAGHVVCGRPLCPASVYHQLALAAVERIEPHASDSETPSTAWALADVSYIAPLLLEGAGAAAGAMRVELVPQNDNFTFEVSSSGRVHCAGTLKRKQRHHVAAKLSRRALTLRRQVGQFAGLQLFGRRAMYEKLFPRVVVYSQPFHCADSIRINADADECLAVCRPPPARLGAAGLPAAEAIFMDVLLHVAGFVANFRVDDNTAAICRSVPSAIVLRTPHADRSTFSVYCSLFDVPADRQIVADAYAFDESGILAVFKGMAFQRVSLTHLSRAFAVPGAGGATSTRSAPLPIEKKDVGVRPVLARTCGVDLASLQLETRLDALGVDSLMTIELQAELATIGVAISAALLATCMTVADLENVAMSSKQPNSRARKDSLATKQPQPDIIPLEPALGRVRAIIAETCGAPLDIVSSDAELHALGIDSLMMLELETRLQELEPLVSTTKLAECRTVEDVEVLVGGGPALPSQASDGGGGSSSSNGSFFETRPASPISESSVELTPAPSSISKNISSMLRLTQQPEVVHLAPQSHSNASPLFLIHDGSGLCTHYHRLGQLGRSTFAIHNPKFLDRNDGGSWPNLQAMAADYADLIVAAAPNTNQVLLGGWSFGGVVAFEAARILMANSVIGVVGVVLIDSPPPVNHQPLSPRIIDIVTGESARPRKRPATAEVDEIRQLTRRSFLASTAMLANHVPSTAGPMPRVLLLRSERGWQSVTECEECEWNPWLQDRSQPRDATAGWEAVSQGEVPHIDIPGDHFQAFDQHNIGAVSAAVKLACDRLEGGI